MRAHRSGIVHRDLKPGNVMLTKSGVKLLDFGLAKLVEPDKSEVSQATSLPTALQQSQPLTTRGTILGTFQYMAPEQLEGRDADARSDIFAFGCVLYEMLTGQKAFTGKSQASLIGSIMSSDPPPISSIQPMIPAVARPDRQGLPRQGARAPLVHGARRDAAAAVDRRRRLAWPACPRRSSRARKNREKLAWGLLAATVVGAAALAFGFARRAPKAAEVMRFDIVPPPEIATMDVPRLSPDGRLLAFDATDMEGKARIWVRPLSSLTAQPLQGTDGGVRPFWSPDSRYVGFIADGVMKKVDVTGGPPTKICDAPGGSDGTWSREGVILFDGTGADPIYRVPAVGGTRTVAVKLDAAKKETSVGWPQFLPDGKHYLYLLTGEKPEDSAYWIASIDSSERKLLAPAQTLVQYAPPGYLLFVRDKTLVAQPFDAKALKTTGEPVPLAERIATDNVGLARFSVSSSGVLAYRTGESGGRLLWRDRSGKDLDTLGEPGDYAESGLFALG